MRILGLNTYHADTSACLIIDGIIVSACEEERFSRIKHFTGFPLNSIKYCLKSSNLDIKDIDFITVNYNFNYNFNERVKFLLSNLKNTSLVYKLLSILNKKNVADLLYENFGEDVKKKIKFVPHHVSHISSSYYTSGFQESVGLSIDATGDFSSLEYSLFKNNKIEIIAKNHYPHSLGIFYQAISQFLGFRKFGDEYKVMALAAFGKPKFKKEFNEIVKFLPPYNFELNLDYFIHQKKFFFEGALASEPYFENLYSRNIENLLGKARYHGEDIEERHKDIAATLQYKFEEIILKIVNNIYLENLSDNICLSGGCFFNSVLNGKIYKLNKFKNISIHANVGDAGGAIGSALYTEYENLSNGFKNNKFENYFLGPSYSVNEIEQSIKKYSTLLTDFEIRKFVNYSDLNDIVANILSKKGVVAWFQGQSEWGPRALGNRSILVDAKVPEIKEILNKKIKLREQFRPFAASVLEEDISNYFNVNEEGDAFPNMNFVLEAKEVTKNKYPAIVHIDGSSRIQSVNKKNNLKFYNLISTFKKKFKSPILLNTSLNIDEPICQSPDDVIKSFANTKVDCIALESILLIKKSIL